MAVSLDRIEAHAEVFRAVVPIVLKDKLHLFRPPSDSRKWQPSDFFPDVARDGVSGWQDGWAEIRKQAQTLSKPLRVIIAGNGITEAGLALFSAAYARLRGVEDVTGIDDNPWAQARRWWLGDENRHHEGIYIFLRDSGIYNMRAIDQTIHDFHRNGFDNEAGLDLYTNLHFVVTQEGDTSTSHHRSGVLAQREQKEAGILSPSAIARLLLAISPEESYHHGLFLTVYGAIFEHDPAGATISMRDMMERGTLMPARYMGSNQNGERSTELYMRYARVANHLGILTPMDNVRMEEKLIRILNISNLSLSGEAADAQADIFRIHAQNRTQAERVADLARRVKAMGREPNTASFKWLAQEA